MSVFFGVVGPKGMAADRVALLNQAYAKALDSDNVKKAFAAQGLERGADTKPAYLAGFVKSELGKWSEVVQKAGVTLD